MRRTVFAHQLSTPKSIVFKCSHDDGTTPEPYLSLISEAGMRRTTNPVRLQNNVVPRPPLQYVVTRELAWG